MLLVDYMTVKTPEDVSALNCACEAPVQLHCSRVCSRLTVRVRVRVRFMCSPPHSVPSRSRLRHGAPIDRPRACRLDYSMSSSKLFFCRPEPAGYAVVQCRRSDATSRGTRLAPRDSWEKWRSWSPGSRNYTTCRHVIHSIRSRVRARSL